MFYFEQHWLNEVSGYEQSRISRCKRENFFKVIVSFDHFLSHVHLLAGLHCYSVINYSGVFHFFFTWYSIVQTHKQLCEAELWVSGFHSWDTWQIINGIKLKLNEIYVD